jgi:hypothetical protein
MSRQNVKRYIAVTALFATLAGAAAPATLWERVLAWCGASLDGFGGVRAKRGAGIDPNGSLTDPEPSDPTEPVDATITRRGAGIDPNG